MKLAKNFLFYFSLFFASVAFSAGEQPGETFRFHLSNEPSTLDPHQQKSSASSYLLQNLYRNLFVYDNDKGLVPDLGESCKRESPLVLVCKLKKGLQWSDGTALTADDFLKGYQRVLNPKESSPRADLLFKIKNAGAIYKGQKKIETLGITAPNSTTLRFEFEEKDPDFEYNLASFLLSPVKNTLKPGQKASELVVNGPYKIADWIAGQKIQLINNTFYTSGNSQKRPLVEVLFVNEDSVALQLYEKNELSFLRRLPTLYIPKFKTRADFHWIPVVRFDYIGFGPALKDTPKLREALALALNYKDLQKVFSSEGVPGCPGIPSSWMTEELCYKFDAKKAKSVLSEEKKIPANLKLMYSSLGGEDHRRATEWMQSQWDKNLGVKVQLLLRENKVFISDLQQNPPALFRKGVAPDRPTCLATLETFADWSPENYIQLKDPEFQELLKKLGDTSSGFDQKKLCTQAVRFLMDRHLLIPLGSIHFAILAKQKYSGWRLNSMNQLDLAGLESKN
ncbi:peptide ABC transporter substrate-binding protein [Bdellovibrio sp. HCB337]|uniref:peptide ABC transporter substrate-binding protein n=1 Tax=Bdellovibrio sp. HCB337 TaxID=3394358 RepID=UPI0039A72C58